MTVAAADVARARGELARLTVARPREGRQDRVRDFGSAWSVDVDRNGCGTRDDILRRDLTEVQLRGRCTVVAGVLADPCTGRTVTFAEADAGTVQIHHVVPLGAAWQRRARDRPRATRERFANDPGNLRATTGSANRSRSDRGPAEWLPPPDEASLTALLARC